MDNVFLFLFCISFLCIPVFIIWALINLIRKKPAKKRFKFAGISVLTLVISIIGFGFTMDNDTSLNESVDIVSEDPTVVAESTNLQPTIAPTVWPTTTPTPTKAPTPKPTASPTPLPTVTPAPTKAPTLEPTASPTPLPTVTPAPRPTETPQPVLQSTETPKPQIEKTPEPQIIAESSSHSVTASETQPGVTSSEQKSGSGSGESNFNTYDIPEQQQTEDAYVLNTSRHKIHYPSCPSVAKIAPQNYATSNLSISELEAQGYTTCGNCFK